MFRRLPFVMGGFLATVAAVQALPAFAQDGSADGAVPTSAAVNLDKSVDPDADQSPASSMADTAMPLASNTPAQAAAPQPPTLQQAIGNPDDFTLSASIRARMESLGNDFRSTANPSDTILSLRTTLAAEYHPGIFRIGGELMDSRIYFDNTKTPVTVNDVNAMELIQAYVGLDLGHVLGKGSDTSVQAGRFTMEFGARRLIARNNFRNDTNAYTGIRFDVTTADKTKITAFYTLPLTRLPSTIDQLVDNSVHWDRESFDLQFWGAYLAKPQLVGRTNLDLYFLGLNERDSPSLATKNRQLYTPGLRLFMNPEAGKPDFEVEADYQFGSVRASTAANAALLDVSAYYVHAELGYQFAGPWKPHVKLVYDRASGDNGKGSYNRFDSLFGARNPDWGPTSIYGALSRSNISSPGVRLDFAHGKRTDGNLTYRAMWLDSATDSFANTGVRDATGKSGTFAGQQVEWRVRYWIVPQFLRLETGAAWLINGRFLKDAPNASGRGNPIYGFFGVTATF